MWFLEGFGRWVGSSALTMLVGYLVIGSILVAPFYAAAWVFRTIRDSDWWNRNYRDITGCWPVLVPVAVVFLIVGVGSIFNYFFPQ